MEISSAVLPDRLSAANMAASDRDLTNYIERETLLFFTCRAIIIVVSVICLL